MKRHIIRMRLPSLTMAPVGQHEDRRPVIGAWPHHPYVCLMARQRPTQAQRRPLTDEECALARSVFGSQLDLDAVRIHRGKWWFLQPRNVTMAPRGHIHFHPEGSSYCDCFASASIGHQGHLIHELVHVWQHQQGMNLILRRHPFCRYHYTIKPGWSFDRYGIEQQAEIVRHAFLLRQGVAVPGAPSLETLESILPFKAA